MTKLTKPVLSPDLPIEDRMLLACLYRMAVEAGKTRNRVAKSLTKHALEAALAASEGVCEP